ncbi:hypothetical protein AAG570_013288 [Ranatra chinensis]|uniref:Uncharacterized protein n=1 Tax=Ranatra chinensis TaxID=642074 RepID=A0ABD0YGC3_9HEMI
MSERVMRVVRTSTTTNPEATIAVVDYNEEKAQMRSERQWTTETQKAVGRTGTPPQTPALEERISTTPKEGRPWAVGKGGSDTWAWPRRQPMTEATRWRSRLQQATGEGAQVPWTKSP